MSIKLKMTLWYSSLMCLMVVIVLGTLLYVSQNIVSTDIQKMLKEIVNEGKDEIDYEDGKLVIDEDLDFFEDGIYMQLYSADAVLMEGILPSHFNESIPFENKAIRMITVSGKKYYVYDRVMEFKKHDDLWLRGIVSGTDAATTIHTMIFLLAVLLPLLAVFSCLIGYAIAKRCFAPIEKIRLAAQEISESKDLSKRIELGKGKDEVYRLAETFDGMFERLEEAFEAEKQLSSDISHELRTPVSVILAHSQYALEEDVSLAEQREILLTIYRQAEHMKRMIGQLLSFTRLERGIDQICLDELNLSELVEVICEEQKIRQEKEIKLEWNIEPDLIVSADFSLMTRLVLNLINNAYQYGKQGGFIKVSLNAKPDHKVRLSVEDNGIGIRKEEQDKIWKRFYQVDASRSKGEKGSMGLGLAMVDWIARAHQGSIKVESEPGKGSCFIFEMPLNTL